MTDISKYVKIEEKREENLMFFSKTDKELISKLKGRLSKALNIQNKLSREEKKCMEGIYETLDRAILGSKKFEEETKFVEAITQYTDGLKATKRKFIKEHIIPLANKIATKKWGTDE